MTTEQIKTRIRYGDYSFLAEVLGISSEAAKMRFLRGDEKTKEILTNIIESRKIILDKHKKTAK